MSDSHNRHRRFTMPEADLFIHAGDFTNFGNGAEEFAIWYWQLPYKHKLLVLGNHEDANAVEKRSLETWRRLFGPTLLHGEAREVRIGDEGLVVYGAPYGMRDFSTAPSNTALIVTHEPPHRILDRASGAHIGETAIAEFVEQLNPLFHIFGHAHASGGKTELRGRTLYVNAATRVVQCVFP